MLSNCLFLVISDISDTPLQINFSFILKLIQIIFQLCFFQKILIFIPAFFNSRILELFAWILAHVVGDMALMQLVPNCLLTNKKGSLKTERHGQTLTNFVIFSATAKFRFSKLLFSVSEWHHPTNWVNIIFLNPKRVTNNKTKSYPPIL